MRYQGTIRLCFCAMLCAALCASSAMAQPAFDLAFGGPSSLTGAAGGTVSASYNCMLIPGGDQGDAGAQGWSISVSGAGLAITDITTDGGIGADVADGGLRNTGFEKSELTTAGDADCSGRNGAVSAVVLSFTMPITAPTDAASRIASVSVEATVPAGGGSATLEYVNSCQGAGQPVTNNVTHGGATIVPTLGSVEIALEEATLCPVPGATLQVGVDGAGLEHSATGDGPALLVAAPGDADVTIVMNSDGLASGVQGWSLSIGVSDGCDLVAATTDGTVGADVSQGGLRNTGFEKTEIVDPAANGGQGQGAVSAVVLSFTMPITLDTTSSADVLVLTVNGDLGESCLVSGNDGLQGAGQPVSNVATVGGATVEFACIESVQVSFDQPPVARYLPGDPNSDGRVDIADPIWIINELFRGGPAAACQQAIDANGDGQADLSDVTFLVEYQFAGGPAPANVGSCVEADPSSPLTCESSGSGC